MVTVNGYSNMFLIHQKKFNTIKLAKEYALLITEKACFFKVLVLKNNEVIGGLVFDGIKYINV